MYYTGEMRVQRTEDIVKDANEWLGNRVEQYKARSLFLPAGETPKLLYAKWRASPPIYLAGLKLYQVDDVIEGPGKGIFAKFFREELPSLVVAPPESPKDADLAILGLGTNGHVAFHEPGLPAEFSFGEVELHADTAERLHLATGTKARTFGVGAFMKSKAVLMIVRGESKRAALKRLLEGDPTLPAAGLLPHLDFTILTDIKV